MAYLDLEMSDRKAQVWARQQRIEHNGDWMRFGLRGLARTFDIRDDVTRKRWAEKLRGYDVLILDPMRPLLDALGLKEATETGVILEAFDALKVEAGVSEGVVIHHMGWDDSHGRGDSRQVDWPDTIAMLRTSDPDDPDALRFLQARGRGDIDIPEGLVSRYDGTRLVYARAGVRQAKESQSVDALAEFVSRNRGCNMANVKSAGLPGVNANTASRIRAEAERRGLIRSEPSPKNSTLLYPIDQ